MGKYNKILTPGCHCYVPCLDRVAGTVSHKIRQLDVSTTTKTKDNVTVTVITALQYHVESSQAYAAFYRLDNPQRQMSSYVDDSVRSIAPSMNLDDLFISKDDISNRTRDFVADEMKTYGITILRTLITDLRPELSVLQAMNEINAAQRRRVAATEEGEAAKILAIAKAEAESEAKRLQGEGVAAQRLAILKGYQEGISQFAGALAVDPSEAMVLTLTTQYFDTLRDIAAQSTGGTATFLPHSPAGVGSVVDQVRNAMLQAGNGLGGGAKGPAASAPMR